MHPYGSRNLVNERDFVEVWLELLGYPFRFLHVLDRLRITEHSLKCLSAAPLRVVGDPCAVETLVDVR
jgi:hypothetical protein